MSQRSGRLPSLRGRVRALLTITFTLIVAIALLTAVSFFRLIDARSELLDEVDPAMLESAQLLASYIDQENGVRGFVLTAGDEMYLEPFATGQAEAARVRESLGQLLATHPGPLDALDEVDRTTQQWTLEYAEPTIVAVRAGGSEPAEEDSLEAGRVLFDEVRRSFAVLQTALEVERSDAYDALGTATTALVVAIVTLAAMSIAAKVVLWRTYHRAVAIPLDRLGADAVAVTEGDLGHRIHRPDHAELAALGDAMEEMRVRLVDDLHSLEETNASLEQKAAELERSNSDLEQFAYVASHDLQEPLRKVISFTQLLQSRYGDQLDERADEYIAYAVDGARRMQDLINDLLAFSRVGRLTRDHVPVALDEVVDQALANLGAAIEEAGATVERSPLPTITGDPVLLVSLFQNLLGNAVKFRREDTDPVVTLAAEHHEGEWSIRVSDNGIGIEPEFEERVFVIFQRLHGKDAYEGTGIGLAMCRKIVEHHGGTIRLEHHDGPGTRFVLTFPDQTPDTSLPDTSHPPTD